MGWLKNTKSVYDKNEPEWSYVDDHLSGAVVSDKAKEYLLQKASGESNDAYDERVKIRDYTPHYMKATISLAGIMWSVSDDATRQWLKDGSEEGLGNPSKEGTTMSELWEDADGKGTNWDTLFRSATIDMIGKRWAWCLVEGVKREDGEVTGPASLRMIPPEAVTDWTTRNGRLVEVKVKSESDQRSSVKEKEDKVEQYFVYTLQGVEVWEEQKGEKDETVEVMVDERPYGGESNPTFQYEDRVGRPILPIFSVQVPIRANIGYMMARKANAIYNLESARDFHLWASAFARMIIKNLRDEKGGFLTSLWKKVIEIITGGDTIIPADAEYIAPPMEGAEIRGKTIEEKVKAFYETFFQSFGDAAKERTATEIKHDYQKGIGAYLTLLSGAVDELENNALWRLEQVYFPDNSDVWGGASVERATEFAPTDPVEQAQLIIQILQSLPMELPTETRLELTKQILDMLGLTYDAEELEEQAESLVEKRRIQDELRQAQMDNVLGAPTL